MDWRSHKVDRLAGPCRICRERTWLRDCAGVRCHKACAEVEAARDLTAAVQRYRSA